ncbi:PREDICTED: uncharacterized protein LOC105366303 [Ceratosolen solmsi marchali]|uniref:Uncharacterized protein LOC105366303 n=1 Tax=Ceratosolen solmsi marchali TaxID=326594 RepID=A0AAJ6YRN6_9HYME|nr:PREDICTED: uncharacterized protein LOC105366303 [Ceratosolen solmsi marchali]
MLNGKQQNDDECRFLTERNYKSRMSIAQADVLNSTDAQTCINLCKSCNGIANFVNNRCECNIEDSIKEGADCVLRMKREATEYGLDVVSCDLSNDKRSTRCLLGTKHEFGNNDIDQVAKYFMEDGPITGSIFQAPPYTFTYPPDTVQSQSNDCVEQPSLFVLNSLQESAYTPRPVEIVSTPRAQHIVSSSQPQYIEANSESQHVLSSPRSKNFDSNSKSQYFVSNRKSECVGAPRIITQPKEAIVAPPIVNCVSTSASGNYGPILEKPKNDDNALIIDDINFILLTEQTNTPNFFQILGEQLSRPMFGIPHAIETVSQTPGISNLVSAPVNLLYTFLQRLNENSNRVASTCKKSQEHNVKIGTSKISISNPIANTINPIVGTQVPPFNYHYPTAGSPLINLLSPSVSIPATAHVSYIQQMPATMPMIHGPILGNISPCNGFVPQVPTTYVVGASLGLPYYSNCNTIAAPVTAFETFTQIDDSPGPFVEHNMELTNDENSGSSLYTSLKKICKKSTKTKELPIKINRDVNNNFKSAIDGHKFETMKKQLEDEIAHTDKQSLSQISNIDNSTTQALIIEQLPSENVNIQRPTNENINNKKTKTEKLIKEKLRSNAVVNKLGKKNL